VRGAILYATALGVYEVTINGVRVGDVELAPGASTYDRTLYAQAYDVAGALRVGQNVIDIAVSDGWFRGRNGGAQVRNVWGDQLAVLAQLEAETSDGSVLVCTGPQWVSLPSPIVRADLMRGQSTDFRIAPEAAEPTPVVTSGIVPPTPSWSPSPPVRRIEERSPASVTPIAPGVSILDAGQNLSGWVRVTDLGPEGSETVLEFAEHLTRGGDITTAHLSMTTQAGQRMVTEQTDQVVAGPDPDQSFEPRHTIHGFRYARITHPGRTIAPESFTVILVHSDLEKVGEFHCDNPDVNRLHAAAEWSFRSNIVDVPTDCPTRERMGWTGDFQVFAPVAAQLYDVDGFASKWMQAVRDDQSTSGVLAAFSPDPERGRLHPERPTSLLGGSAGWGDAAVAVPWALYREYGDTQVLRANWDTMAAWAGYALACARDLRHPDRVARRPNPAAHERFIWDGPFHFGEWLEPKLRLDDGTLVDPMADMMTYMSADRGEVGTAYLFRTVDTLSNIADVLGDATEAKRYSDTAEKVRDAWRTEFLHRDGTTESDTQAAYVRALSFGLIPDSLRQRSAARLAELVTANGDRLATGFLSSGMLLPVLADAGYVDLAYRVLLQTQAPSWLYMLNHGATTMWEDWDGVTSDGEAHESLNHYSKGAVIAFLHEYVAGLRQSDASAGWERFAIAPVPGGGVQHAKYTFQSPRGEIAVEWHDGDKFVLDLTAPSTSTADVTLPDGSVHVVRGGRHRLAGNSTTALATGTDD